MGIAALVLDNIIQVQLLADHESLLSRSLPPFLDTGQGQGVASVSAVMADLAGPTYGDFGRVCSLLMRTNDRYPDSSLPTLPLGKQTRTGHECCGVR